MDITQGAPFESFGLSEATMRAIHNKGYEVSTPVQAGCIPPMLAGKDVIAKAPTGTGKTMAFGIPIIERIDPESETVQAVILAPTRELAMQITEEMREVAVCHEGVRLVCLYGGQPIGKQINALKRRPQIVGATPGRCPPWCWMRPTGCWIWALSTMCGGYWTRSPTGRIWGCSPPPSPVR